MRKILVPLATTAGAAALVLSAAAPAMAVAVYDAETGIGTVGKGDVQVPFGWNNATLQNNAAAVTFTYVEAIEYDVTCKQQIEVTEINPANGKEQKKKVNVFNTSDASAAVVYDTTKATKNNPNGSVTGFKITSTTLASSGAAPVEGSACSMDDGTSGKISAVEATGEAVRTLSAKHGTISHPVWVDGVSIR